jgi:hypothetical protein
MNQNSHPIWIGDTLQQQTSLKTSGEFVTIQNERFYKISHFDRMSPFFISLVSSSNHWLFIGSTGGLSAGRVNANQALFPYYTVDKIIENFENTGSKTIFLVTRDNKRFLWEPFSNCSKGIYQTERNLYKNITGTQIIFEEINHDLNIKFSYSWRTSDKFGFVKTSAVQNLAASDIHLDILDGIQNILPANTPEDVQRALSSLLDAYKRNELDAKTGLGIFTLNSKLTDLAEPSESLLATIAWYVGATVEHNLLSSHQLETFRLGKEIETEHEACGVRGSYFIHKHSVLSPDGEEQWYVVADVNQDAANIVNRKKWMGRETPLLVKEILEDLRENSKNLEKIVASADGLQTSNKELISAHLFANVMFNEMRGGYFPGQYIIQKNDFLDYIAHLNHEVFQKQKTHLEHLPETISINELKERIQKIESVDLIRLTNSYLPLSFSRRHGDPSRPWNRFNINIKKLDGSLQLDYEGNWRDIFQNWEALVYSYPEYVENMISVFLNSTTVDGYNPYRITRHGIDWEVPEPGNPWANIGYWSDHQIIYLLKLLEISTNIHPGRLNDSLNKPVYSYSNVPYRIKPYKEIEIDPYNTIDFDWELEERITELVKEKGRDGKLVLTEDGAVLHASLTEKLLSLILAKIVNFAPEGGIWMNTQRPEWNDANNALVGKGLSIVTLAYLRRFVVFFRKFIKHCSVNTFPVHSEVAELFNQLDLILHDNEPLIYTDFTDENRRSMIDKLGQSGSDYRWKLYENDFSGQKIDLSYQQISNFLDLVRKFCDHTLMANRRNDDLYHSYNILHLEAGKAKISHLYEMLEGQVAILSSGLLDGSESLSLLRSLRNSSLYQADQHSYILYPDRKLSGFIERNTIDPDLIKDLKFVKELEELGDKSLFVRDDDGLHHFAGQISNTNDLKVILSNLHQRTGLTEIIFEEESRILELFERTFNHYQFTGRSGTFFAYEGLGSIYWHMVSKLLLAVQETIFRTRDEVSITELIKFYNDIRAGQCFNKTPADYGAFPTDPYSHTPANQGAKQPGMTGLVKEEILSRLTELGISFTEGRLGFDFLIFDRDEFLKSPKISTFYDVSSNPIRFDLLPGTMINSICQVPVILKASSTEAIHIHFSDSSLQKIPGHWLDLTNTRHIIERDGIIHHLEVFIPTLTL